MLIQRTNPTFNFFSDVSNSETIFDNRSDWLFRALAAVESLWNADLMDGTSGLFFESILPLSRAGSSIRQAGEKLRFASLSPILTGLKTQLPPRSPLYPILNFRRMQTYCFTKKEGHLRNIVERILNSNCFWENISFSAAGRVFGVDQVAVFASALRPVSPAC